jgi:hypothetical protein
VYTVQRRGKKMRKHIWALLVILCMTLLANVNGRAGSSEASRYIFVWSGDAARKSTDFLAVVDAEPSSGSYARIIATVPVNVAGTMPHHTERISSRKCAFRERKDGKSNVSF